MYITEEAQEAIDAKDSPDETESKQSQGEMCLLSTPSIIVSLEMDIGNETIPVLVMQASLEGQVKDWSSDVSYFFSRLVHSGSSLVL